MEINIVGYALIALLLFVAIRIYRESDFIHLKCIISDVDDPKDTEYGGFWYLKGRRSQKELMEFYKKFDFVEDSSVYTDWCIFSEIPYPSMRCNLE